MAHIPVMYEECLEGLNIRPDGIYVDMTIGGFGHGIGICDDLSDKGTDIGFDLDEAALVRARKREADLSAEGYLSMTISTTSAAAWTDCAWIRSTGYL